MTLLAPIHILIHGYYAQYIILYQILLDTINNTYTLNPMLSSRVPSVTQVQQMVVLATINSSNMLELQQPGMTIINDFLNGQMHLICFEDFQNNGYTGTLKFSRSSLKSSKTQNTLYIRPSHIVDPKSKKNLFFMELVSNNDAAKEKLHIFASLISSVMIVVIQLKSNASLLGSINTRVVKQRMLGSSSSGGTYAASLICVNPIHSQDPDHFIDATNYFIDRFKQENILPQVLGSYSGVFGVECAQQGLINLSGVFNNKLSQQIDIATMSDRQNTQFMYGPILVKYIQNIAKQINNGNGKINLNYVEENITIDSGYDAYMAAVQKFHKTGLALVDRNTKPDDNQLQQMLDTAKLKAFQQFYARGGSANHQYRVVLDDYIQIKSKDIIQLYSQQQWNRNVKILEKQSDLVLSKISSSNVKDRAVIMGYMNQMSRNYSQSARGPKKYQLLSEYLKDFTPFALQTDPAKQALLREQRTRNQDLQARLAQLSKQNKKSGGCCGGKCSIM